jgi:ribosomal protein S18 acetylase RimI-like enzyme
MQADTKGMLLMKSSMLHGAHDVQEMRELREQLASRSTIVDFEEQILLSSIRATTRLWKQDNQLVGFAFIDEYNNLWFETKTGFAALDELEAEIIGWGITCLERRNAETGTDHFLDCTCDAQDSHRLSVLQKHGFVLEQIRSLRYSRSLNEPITEYPLPSVFLIRCVRSKSEVEQLVALHRAAFGTNHMTVEYRLAMMSTPQYISEMDLVAVTPNDELIAFCVCGFEDPDKKIGYTDPIGTHPSYQRMGLGKALVSAGLIALKKARAHTVRLGTSSENIAMQKLASESGFVCVSEKVWLSRPSHSHPTQPVATALDVIRF